MALGFPSRRLQQAFVRLTTRFHLEGMEGHGVGPHRLSPLRLRRSSVWVVETGVGKTALWFFPFRLRAVVDFDVASRGKACQTLGHGQFRVPGSRSTVPMRQITLRP